MPQDSASLKFKLLGGVQVRGYCLSGMRLSGGVGGCGRDRNGLGALSAAYAQIMEYGLIFNVYWVI